MNLLIGAATIGLILSLLGLGVFVSYRIYHMVDLTTDGSFGLGAAVTGALLVGSVHPIPATLIGTLAGAVAGALVMIISSARAQTRLLRLPIQLTWPISSASLPLRT